jgi:hypothetical protein
MGMVRKHVHLAPRQQHKLRELAAKWNRSESEIVRMALDSLPDPERSTDQEQAFIARLEAAGLLEPLPTDGAPSADQEIAAMEQEHEAWLATLKEPLRLAESVIDDRR